MATWRYGDEVRIYYRPGPQRKRCAHLHGAEAVVECTGVRCGSRLVGVEIAHLGLFCVPASRLRRK